MSSTHENEILTKLRCWVEVELAEADVNVDGSQDNRAGAYYSHNFARQQTLRKVIDKIDVLSREKK